MSNDNKTEQAEIIQALNDIKQQNKELLEKVEQSNAHTIKTAAITGAASGGIIAVGVEFIRIKLGL
ncbi:MAG: hypothetical protein KGV50_00300 [Gammaproteobacteria bacterium]|nr:hypothetical protein [Gammaproteobacteria bacterium]